MNKLKAPALSTSFSESGKNAKCRFENILNIKVKKHGIFIYIAILFFIIIIGTLVSCESNGQDAQMPIPYEVMNKGTIPEVVFADEKEVILINNSFLIIFDIEQEKIIQGYDLKQFGFNANLEETMCYTALDIDNKLVYLAEQNFKIIDGKMIKGEYKNTNTFNIETKTLSKNNEITKDKFISLNSLNENKYFLSHNGQTNICSHNDKSYSLTDNSGTLSATAYKNNNVLLYTKLDKTTDSSEQLYKNVDISEIQLVFYDLNKNAIKSTSKIFR